MRAHPSFEREKEKLSTAIYRARQQRNLPQTVLAEVLGVSQPRIAQIENLAGPREITIDVLLKVLCAMGYDFKITVKKS